LKSGKNTGEHYSDDYIKHFNTTLSAVKRFLKHRKQLDIPLTEINKSFYNSFKKYCFQVEHKEISTFSNFIKNIKLVMKESKSADFDSADFVKPSYEADTIYLTTEQIDQVAELDLSDPEASIEIEKSRKKKNIFYPTLDKERDLFLIGCYTGLRYSDFSKLDLKSIDDNFIKLKQTKTASRVVIPIMSKLRPILAKYPEELPRLSNQRLNDYIKSVAKLAGLVQEQEKRSTKGNVATINKAPLYTLISSHCCRRSYATNMFNTGVPSMLIMSATGHKTESSFLKYIRATNQDKAELMADIMKKLGL
jgi:integrase